MRPNLLATAAFVLASTSSCFAQSSVTIAPPQMEVIESYRAFIGRDDLFNSSGNRLTKPWEVLRQDRANFHQFGTRQRNEDSDTFFASPENRSRMESMVRDGFTSQEAGDTIVNGLVWVNVQILGSGTSGRAVRISVER
jgi:hypothetical protein